jgi:anti-anti-sigma regulatory factor
MNPRRITTILLSLSIMAVAILMIMALLRQQWIFAGADAVGLVLTAGLLAAHVRGFRWTAQVAVCGMLLITLGALPPDPLQDNTYAFNLLTPVVLAAVLLPWYWSAGIFVVCYGAIAVLWGGQGPLFNPSVVILLCLQAGGIALASVVARAAQRKAEDNALSAQTALGESERQKVALADQAETLSLQNEEQRRLLDLVATLEVPIVALASGVLFAPVVGAFDSRRAQALTARLLQAVSDQRAQLVVLDIAGIATVDTAMARALIEAAQAVRLLGCDIIISGIAAATATTLTHLNIGLGNIKTARSPQEALEQYQHLIAQGVARTGWRVGRHGTN